MLNLSLFVEDSSSKTLIIFLKKNSFLVEATLKILKTLVIIAHMTCYCIDISFSSILYL